jgi:dihydroflavonol-4-reductase
MTSLVTGATGFIGSAVVRRLLARGRAVRCLVEPGADRRNLTGLDVEVVEGDIGDRRAVASALVGVTSLFHLAAIYKIWLPDNRAMYDVNVEGTKTVLFAALEAGVARVVHTSSIAAVGLSSPDGTLSDETTEFNHWALASHYIRSKWLSERDAMRFAAEGLPVVVVNPAFPFGPRDRAPTPTGRFIVEALRGRVPGYLEGGFNAVDVDDVAEGHVAAEERGRVGERYILGCHNVTYKEFYDAVASVAGLPPIRRRLPTPLVVGAAWVAEKLGDLTRREPFITYDSARYATRKVWFDCSKAQRELGLARTPLVDTIGRAVEWFRANDPRCRA